MLSFLIRRLLVIAPTLLFVSMQIFGLQQLLPGDPALALAGEDRDPEVIAFIHQKYHLDAPLPARHALWLEGALRGDLGDSIRDQEPVARLIAQKLPVTIELSVLAMLVALMFGIPAGVIAAVKKESAWDYLATLPGLSGLSIPNFWLGIMLILLFSIRASAMP